MKNLISVDTVANRIFVIRGKSVMLDSDLAQLYEVETKRLNEQVKRNSERFPEDFMFQLTKEEADSLRSHFATLNKSQVSSKRGKHAKYLPLVFTQEGVAMLSGVLNSPRAIQVNIQIMRAFVQLRRMLLTNVDLRRKIEDMERKYSKKFSIVFRVLKQLLEVPQKNRLITGFTKVDE